MLKKKKKLKPNQTLVQKWNPSSQNQVYNGENQLLHRKKQSEIPEIFSSCGLYQNQIERDREKIFLYNKHICIQGERIKTSSSEKAKTVKEAAV